MANTTYTGSGYTTNFIGGAPIPGPTYTPPGGSPEPLSDYNSADPSGTGKNTFNPQTGLNAQGLTPGQQAAQDYTNSTAGVNTVKSTPIQNTINTTLGNENQLQTTELQTFNDYLKQAQQQQQQQEQSIAADQSTIAKLPTELNTELSNAVTQFANTGAQITGQVGALNTANANTVNTNIANLAALDQQQTTAEQAAAQKAVADAQATNAARYSAGGTPNSGGGYQEALAANTEAGIMLPVTAAGFARQANQLQNYISPQQQQLYAQNIAQLTGLELPLAQTLAGMGITNAQQVSQLQQALVGKTLSEQIQFLSTLGIPVQMAQQLAQSLPSAVGQLSATNLNNNQYALTQNYQNPLAGGLPTTNYGLPNQGGGFAPQNYRSPGGSPSLPNSYGVQSGQQPLQSNPNQGPGMPQPVTVSSPGAYYNSPGGGVPYTGPTSYSGFDTSGLQAPVTSIGQVVGSNADYTGFMSGAYSSPMLGVGGNDFSDIGSS
jgi:hypothetical protein